MKWRHLPYVKKTYHNRKLLGKAMEMYRKKGMDGTQMYNHYKKDFGVSRINMLRLQESARRDLRKKTS